jgi:hypothetical protein
MLTAILTIYAIGYISSFPTFLVVGVPDSETYSLPNFLATAFITLFWPFVLLSRIVDKIVL